MSRTYSAGVVTAYGAAKRGGYTGTYDQFCQALGNLAEQLENLENLSVTVSTLPAGSSATASYADGVLTLGIPKGDTGATGPTGPQGPAATVEVGTVTTLPAGSSATVTNSGSSQAAVFNFGIPKGDTGEVSQVEFDELSDSVEDLRTALRSGAEADAEWHLGFYLDENGDLCQVEEGE